MRILYVGVFDASGHSTNTSQLLALKALGHDVVGYNYRQKAALLGTHGRDAHLCSTAHERNFDLIIFSKCNSLSPAVFEELTKVSKTCLWFMDPLSTLLQHPELLTASSVVDYFCCDKKMVFEEVLKINKNCFHVCEGYDQEMERPHNLKKVYDISFIGNVYGDRESKINQVNRPVNILNNAYGPSHSIEVSKTRINLNFCTDSGASDRVYKVMAAGGFLLTDDWAGRADKFVDGEDLVIFEGARDLNAKIEYYLKNSDERDSIAHRGLSKVQQFNRISWASKIVDLSHGIQKNA